MKAKNSVILNLQSLANKIEKYILYFKLKFIYYYFVLYF